MLVQGSNPRLVQGLADKTNSEDRLLGLVQKLHLPFGVFLEFAGNAADHIAANAGQLFPRGNPVGKLDALFGGAGVFAISDAKKIERHGTYQYMRAIPGLWDLKKSETPETSPDERYLLNGFSKPGQINPGCLRSEVRTAVRIAKADRSRAGDGDHSLSVIRIRPSPVTTRPLAVSVT